MNSKCCSWSLIGLPVIFLHIAAFVKIKKGQQHVLISLPLKYLYSKHHNMNVYKSNCSTAVCSVHDVSLAGSIKL